MKAIRFLVLCLMLVFPAQAGAQKILSATTPDDARKIALTDIKQHHFLLYVQGGFSPVVRKDDAGFEKKYKTDITDFGCVGLDRKIVSAYNREVFLYLDKTYGTRWRKELRKDVIGFREFLEKK
jgi:hypothetical protein